MGIWIDIVTLAVIAVVGILIVAFTAPMVSKTLRGVPTEKWANLTPQINEAVRPISEEARKNDFDFVRKMETQPPKVVGTSYDELFNDDPVIQLRAFLDNYRERPNDLDRFLLIEAINQVIGREEIRQGAAELVEMAMTAIHEDALGKPSKSRSEGGA